LAITSDVTSKPVEGSAIEAFKAGVRGEVLRPGDEGYDAARKVYNAMIDRHPALIVGCVDVADVIGAVTFAREHQLTVSIRGGGHNVVGFAVNDGGLVVDLSRMKGIRVDVAGQTVRAEGGVTWGDLDHATHPFGFAVPGGIVSTTGIAGLTLGGGIGNLTRTYGLSCDSLISADVVTADGRFITASADKNADLFWGLRGGGGNFGVVTSFEYRMRPVSTVLGGLVFYPIEMGREAMRFYRDFMATAPEELNTWFGFHVAPPAPFIPEHLHGTHVCAISVCYVGPLEQGEQVIKPIREFGPPALDLVGPVPFPALNSSLDALVPKGNYDYWKTDFVTELPDEAIEVHAKHGALVPTISSGMHMYPVNGAARRVSKTDTAHSYRETNYAINIYGMWPDPADNAANMAWVRDYWTAQHPFSEPGGYINFLGDEGEDRIKATYQENYGQLVALKNKYDPTNLFHMNQNIKPTV
jgi:FAD/FMN-containing dehydrogenase